MPSTIKLQSPRWDGTNGDQLLLPVSTDDYQGKSLADILTLFAGQNVVFDFAQLREVIHLVGFLTQQACVDAGFANPTHFRDRIRRVRSVWPVEDGTLAGGNWGSAGLPADERDPLTSRAVGKARLILDKTWNTGTGAYDNFFLYGTVGDFRFGPRAAASGRDRIPYTVTFLVGHVRTGST